LKILFYLTLIPVTIFISCSQTKSIYNDDNSFYLTVKNATWTLSFPKYEFKVEDFYFKQDYGYYILGDQNSGLIVAIEIEKLKKDYNAIDFREYFINNSSGTPFLSLSKNLIRYEINDIACVEYFVDIYERENINQNNITAIFIKKGYSIKVHVSKVNYTSTFHEMMLDFIRAISFNEKIES
jgi:hypothetical protein